MSITAWAGAAKPRTPTAISTRARRAATDTRWQLCPCAGIVKPNDRPRELDRCCARLLVLHTVRARSVVILGLALWLPAPAAAWGPVAHRVIARVAARHLSPVARHEVARLLEGQSLADVAFWADEIRERRSETLPWHYVDIPRGAHDYQPASDCRPPERGA